VDNDMKIKTNIIASVVALSAFVLPTHVIAESDNYPEKPITWVIPDGAGGGLDSIVRTIYPYVQKYMPNDAQFVMKNLPGATQTIALSNVYNAEPDGYTIGQASVAPLTIMPHLGKTKYSGIENFELIANVFDAAHFLVVPGNSPYNTFEEFMSDAKKNPGSVKVGLDGVYNVQHLPLLDLQQKANTDLNEIVYKSSANTKKALLGGEIESGILPSHTFIAEYESGSLKPLINIMEVKPSYLSEIPSLKDKGFTPGQLFVGVVAPKGTPKDRLNILNEAIKKALQDPELLTALAKRKLLVNYNGTEEYKARLESIDAVNKNILKELGVLK
jgi:tripartite-type tricarboxylate transporter receptor subunit TctC